MFELSEFFQLEKNHGTLSDDLADHFNFIEPKFLLTQGKRSFKGKERGGVLGRCSAYNQEVQCIKTLRAHQHRKVSLIH